MAVTFERHFDLNEGLNTGVGPSLTYARSAAARHWHGGDLEVVTANTPRLRTTHFAGGGARPRGLLLERAAENLIPVGDFFDELWGLVRIVRDSQDTSRGLVGAQFKDTVQGDNTFIVLDNLTITDTVTYTFSWISKMHPTGTVPWMYFTTNAVVGVPKQYMSAAAGGGGANPQYDDRGSVDLGDGYFRHWVTFTANEATGSKAMQIYMALADEDNSFTGDETHLISYYNAQLEIGTSATTWTPDDVTRGAGTCTAAFVPGTATTLYIEGVTNTGPGVVLQIDDGTEDERYRVERDATNAMIVTVTDGGVEQAAIDAGDVADSTFFRLAIRLEASDFSASLDGAAVVVDGAGTLPTMDTLRIGHAFTAGGEWDSLISKVLIEDAGRTDAELVTMSGSGAFAEASNGGAQIADVITDLLFEDAA